LKVIKELKKFKFQIMLKKIIIFIILIINAFAASAQTPKYFYHLERRDSILYLKWDRNIGGSIEIEVLVNGEKTLYRCPSSDGERELRLGVKPKPKIKVSRKDDNQTVAMELDKPAATPPLLLSDGSCILLPSDSMRAKRKKDVFQLTFEMKKSCNLSDSTLVRTRLYWSVDSSPNPARDHLLTEQILPFGKKRTLTGKYSMDKVDKNGFLFLQIVDEKGNLLLVSEAIFAED
jgi:hypothetical protein